MVDPRSTAYSPVIKVEKGRGRTPLHFPSRDCCASRSWTSRSKGSSLRRQGQYAIATDPCMQVHRSIPRLQAGRCVGHGNDIPNDPDPLSSSKVKQLDYVKQLHNSKIWNSWLIFGALRRVAVVKVVYGYYLYLRSSVVERLTHRFLISEVLGSIPRRVNILHFRELKCIKQIFETKTWKPTKKSIFHRVGTVAKSK